MNPIRNSSKALVIREDRLLCTKNEDQFGTFYLLPGGGQRPGETLPQSLRRECKEEIGPNIKLKMGDIVFVREYIGRNHQFAKWEKEEHQVEYIFECEFEGIEKAIKSWSKRAEEGRLVPDEMQIGLQWLRLGDLAEGRFRFYPRELIPHIRKGEASGQIYIGDIN